MNICSNTDLNANTFFLNKAGQKRAAFTQNQYGAAIGGPIRKDRTFVFMNWEQIDLRLGTTTTTTVPTAAERTGDFSAKGIPSIFDPLTTCGTADGRTCAKDANGNPIYSRTPFAGNVIPTSRLSPALSEACMDFTAHQVDFSSNDSEGGMDRKFLPMPGTNGKIG